MSRTPNRLWVFNNLGWVLVLLVVAVLVSFAGWLVTDALPWVLVRVTDGQWWERQSRDGSRWCRRSLLPFLQDEVWPFLKRLFHSSHEGWREGGDSD
jgi:hypothetical protein